MNETLTNHWNSLFHLLGKSEVDTSAYLLELETLYNKPSRHYHNLDHIDLMLEQSAVFDYSIELQLAIWYHDSVYSPFSKSNEENSAKLAAKHLESLQILIKTIEEVKRLIMLTKTHFTTPIDTIGNQLLDLDLAILASEESTYLTYTNNIRAEYSMFPDIIYKNGRSKIAKEFIEMAAIFKTKAFTARETKARLNLINELKSLES